MPARVIPLVKGQIYHIFNRSIDRKPIFRRKHDNDRVMDTLNFYRFSDVPIRLSYFLRWSEDQKSKTLNMLKKEGKVIVSILGFCLMPNHFHLLLRQESEGGISTFLSQFQNSFTRYFNTRYTRTGHLFEGQFEAVRIETEEQLIHVSRYIHLNLYTSYIVKTFKDLTSHPYSSFAEYLGTREGFCTKKTILSHFKNSKDYRNFVFDRADYQRALSEIKHLTLEDS